MWKSNRGTFPVMKMKSKKKLKIKAVMILQNGTVCQMKTGLIGLTKGHLIVSTGMTILHNQSASSKIKTDITLKASSKE